MCPVPLVADLLMIKTKRRVYIGIKLRSKLLLYVFFSVNVHRKSLPLVETQL